MITTIVRTLCILCERMNVNVFCMSYSNCSASAPFRGFWNKARKFDAMTLFRVAGEDTDYNSVVSNRRWWSPIILHLAHRFVELA